jgi:hypothetical protein
MQPNPCFSSFRSRLKGQERNGGDDEVLWRKQRCVALRIADEMILSGTLNESNLELFITDTSTPA